MCYTVVMTDKQTTVGQLKACLAALPDDAPLLILYDSQAGVSTTIDLVHPKEPVEWAEPGTVYLDISRGRG